MNNQLTAVEKVAKLMKDSRMCMLTTKSCRQLASRTITKADIIGQIADEAENGTVELS